MENKDGQEGESDVKPGWQQSKHSLNIFERKHFL
jgi:hypothetical protein